VKFLKWARIVMSDDLIIANDIVVLVDNGARPDRNRMDTLAVYEMVSGNVNVFGDGAGQ
jgi:hypothetical protein